MKFRIELKILLYIYMALAGHALQNISDLLFLRSPSRALSSSEKPLLKVPCCKYKSRADYSFCVIASKLWNSVPVPVRLATSVATFKLYLKTFFSLAFEQPLFYTEMVYVFIVLFICCKCDGFFLFLLSKYYGSMTCLLFLNINKVD